MSLPSWTQGFWLASVPGSSLCLSLVLQAGISQLRRNQGLRLLGFSFLRFQRYLIWDFQSCLQGQRAQFPSINSPLLPKVSKVLTLNSHKITQYPHCHLDNWVFPPEVTLHEQEGNLACTFLISPHRSRHTLPKTTTETQILTATGPEESPKAKSLFSLSAPSLRISGGTWSSFPCPGRGNSHTHTEETEQRHPTQLSTTAQITPPSYRQ